MRGWTTDLKFLIMGGRVSKASGAIGTILNICPLIELVKDGTLKVKEKLRGKRKAIARLEEKMEELAENGLQCREAAGDDRVPFRAPEGENQNLSDRPDHRVPYRPWNPDGVLLWEGKN